MEPASSFHPNVKAPAGDGLADRLYGLARILLIATYGLLPVLFVPSAYMPLSSGKTLIVMLAVALSIAVFVLSMLREGSLSLRFPLPIVGLWLIAIATVASAVLSGDLRDALFGDGLESYTAAFAVLMAVVATSVGILGRHQSSIIKLYSVLIGSGLVLSLFHVARFIFGPNALSFGVFNSATASPIGSWNGLAIFYGLVVLLSLLVLQQLPLSRVGRYIIMGVIVLSLAMLAVVNFSLIWWVLAFVAGSIAIHHLIGNLWRKNTNAAGASQSQWSSLAASLLVVLVSVVLLVGGARLSGAISERLGISFVEVRPSVTATIDIASGVYHEDLIFGIGPNHFTDAWRLYKDPVINQTIFWDAQFDSGFSYILTSIINTGLVGIIAWVFFLAVLVWSGIRFLWGGVSLDRFWYFIGLSSLVSSLYFWAMSLVYVPPPSIMILAAVTTGIFVVAAGQAAPARSLTLSVARGRSYGFALIAIAVIVISATGYGTYVSAKQVAGVYSFSRSLSTVTEGDTLNSIEEKVSSAFDLSPNDFFARQLALYRLAEMQSILSVTEPTAEQQQTFQDSVSRGIQAASTAVSLDPTDPFNHRVLGQIYSILALVGVEGAADRAKESFGQARQYDPRNPTIPLLEADLAATVKDTASARSLAEESVGLKPDYTEALFFLAQLDIGDGNLDRAISIVVGLAQLEPQNPARRYQLGVLLASAGRLNEAVTAFEQAVALDSQYANARYFLALGYAEQGKTNEAIEQLSVVSSLNESNSSVNSMIEELRSTGTLSTKLTQSETVSDRDSSSSNITDQDLESGLVTSSNPVPEAGSSTSTSTAEVETVTEAE